MNIVCNQVYLDLGILVHKREKEQQDAGNVSWGVWGR